MSEHATTSRSCPPLEILLRVLDVDPAVRDVSRAMAHVRQCPTCQERVDQIEGTFDILSFEFATDLARYHDSAASMARTHEFHRALHKQKQEVVCRPPLRLRRWVPTAVAIVLFAVMHALLRMQTEVVLSANELLQQAEYVERVQPIGTHQRLAVTFRPAPPDRTRVKTLARVSGTLTLVDGRIAPDRTEAYAALVRHFGEGHNWHAPMSVASIRRWRQEMGPDARSRVIVPSRASNLLILSITASRGELRKAQLEVQRTSYHVVRQTLVFADGLMLEISELERWTDPSPRSPAKPLERTPSEQTNAPMPAPSSSSSSAAISRPGLTRWMERTFGDRREGPKFVPELRRLAALVTRRLKELRALESDPDPNVDANARVLYEVLSEDLNALEIRLHILFGSANRSLRSKSLPDDWRRRVAEATAHSIRLERLIDTLLTHDDVLPVDGKIVPEFAALWETVNGAP